MDQGKPLENCLPGPWTKHVGDRAQSRASSVSVLQHHPKMVFRKNVNHKDLDTNPTPELCSSTTILPLQYESLVSSVDLPRYAPYDPLALCTPLFAHAAFSEVQFLNLMESRIQTQINTITEGDSGDAHGTLHYYSSILDRHGQQLKSSTRAIHKLGERSRRETDNARRNEANGSSHDQDRYARFKGSTSTFTSRGLLEDFEELQARCAGLSELCIRGITLAMNKATIEESRKAIEQSARLKRLTLLATLFIPLSFTSSIMGMNIDLLGQNSVKFWWFFVLCLPITLFAYMMYLWDYVLLRRHCLQFWKRCKSKLVSKSAVKPENDPSHIV